MNGEKKLNSLTEGNLKKGGLNERPTASQRLEPPKPQPPATPKLDK